MTQESILYYGDNLDVLKQHVSDASVDLIYLDPPFSSGRNYNMIFPPGGDGVSDGAQIQAFTDTWQWDEKAAATLDGVLKGGGKLAEALSAMRIFLGSGSTMAYLAMMAPRLAELRRVLKDTGSIYLHCDPSASHYLKILMDAIFGVKNFRNEIVWCYRKWNVAQPQFVSNHDILLFYSKTEDHHFTVQYLPKSPKSSGGGKQIQSIIGDDGKRKSVFLDLASVGTPMPDWWEISMLNPMAKERLGYPTQKPEALLERIIKASCPPGGTILDPFSGCGTTIAVASRLGFRWIGIDITHLAVGVIKKRLLDAYGDTTPGGYKVIGEPVDLAGAQQLAKEDTHQFEHWALGLIGARASAKGKGADRGIDGVLLFNDVTGTKTVPISVKSGKVSTRDIRDLRGVMGRDKSPLGIFVTLQEPSKDMKAEALEAGFYEVVGLASILGGEDPPRIQILSIREILEGKRPRIPMLAGNVTLKHGGK